MSTTTRKIVRVYTCQGSHALKSSDISTPPPDTGPRLNKTEDGNLVADVDPRELGWTPVRIKDRVGAHLDWYCPECKAYAENAQYYEDI
mgnify:CR=1 FL=1